MLDPPGKRALTMAGGSETREIVIAHAAEIQPVTAVKGIVLQTSLGQLQQAGHFDEYTRIADPVVLERLRYVLASEWAPLELAEAHYQTCDLLGLSDADIAKIGQRAGKQLQGASLVSRATKTHAPVWSAFGSLHRVWARQFIGGSVQVIKFGPNECGLELCRFGVQRFRYYRQAQLAVLRATFELIGAQVQSVRAVSYNAAQDEAQVRIVWDEDYE